MNLESLDPALSERLRAEADGMAAAYRDALLAESPPDSIVGVYVKGSSQRPWDTLIDYVPELSDVDIHVRSAEDAPSVIRSFPYALLLAEVALAGFRRRFPSPEHTPRPQLFFLDRIERLPGYLPSPADAVHTLFGPEYRAGTRAEYDKSTALDAERFATDAAFVLSELAGKVIDRPGKLLWRVVSTLTFRLGPSGPRLLTQLGMPPFDAWSLNRTSVVRELVGHGHQSLAQHYADFYRAGWDGFRSAFTDDQAARRALSAAFELYSRGAELLEKSGEPRAMTGDT